MRKVYICSPLRAETKQKVEENRLQAIEYMGMVEVLLNNPDIKAVAPHAYLPLLLDDRYPDERKLALSFGRELLSLCEAIFVCGDVLSEGMIGEIQSAIHKPIYVQELSMLAPVKAKAPGSCPVKSIYELIYGGVR